jgi:Flp pilus assembly pilin Flp
MSKPTAVSTGAPNRNFGSDERGITLIEVMVYALLLSVVIAIAGGMIFSAVTTSKTVVSITENSTAGQLVARSVVTGIRNSSDFQLSGPVGDDQMLVARRAGSNATLTWSCEAWYYAATDNKVWFTSSNVAILPPTAAEVVTWTLLTEDVQPVSGSAIFTALNDRLSISILGLDGAHRPIDITSSATSRAGASGSLSCY